MTNFQLRTPVAFIIFNRPDTTAKVFAQISKAKPPKLFVVADGPRSNRFGEVDLVRETRKIIDNVDWKCEVSINYSDINMGCKNRVSSGLDWVFEQVDEAIVLEDDCLPDLTFFQFCDEILEKYRHDDRVGMVCGTNFNPESNCDYSSYFFSRYNIIWGWATWRRAWKNYDVQMRRWLELKNDNFLHMIVHSNAEKKFWTDCFDSVVSGKVDTWDYQWVFASFSTKSMAIVPKINLISNIGFRPDATHTTGNSEVALLETKPMEFPLHHPKFFHANSFYDIKLSKDHFSKRGFVKRLVSKIKKLMCRG